MIVCPGPSFHSTSFVVLGGSLVAQFLLRLRLLLRLPFLCFFSSFSGSLCNLASLLAFLLAVLSADLLYMT